MDNAEVTIFVVDDEDAVRKSLVRELKVEGFQVAAAASGRDAIDALQDRQFDLVITDLMMPGIDGFGVLKAVKDMAPMTSVIILTGYGNMHFAIDALRLGADDFTLKPCEIEELIFRIRRCLDKRSLLTKLAIQKMQLEEEVASRRQAEEQLRESDNRYRLALDGSSNGVWDYNILTGEMYYGDNWYRSLGYGHEAENGGEPSFETLLHPDDRDRVLALRSAFIEGKAPRYEVEYRLRTRSGSWNWVLSRGQAVSRDGEGRAERILGTQTDITRLKEVEAELIHYQAELEQRVLKRTAELQESNIALKVVLEKRENDRALLADQVVANTASLIEPFLDKLQGSRLTEQQRVLVEILRANIKELTSPFATRFTSKAYRLTPAEIQVANLVKMGKRTKEIAEIMHLSPGTISIHRKNIRKKLDLTHQKTNLQTILSINA